MMESIWDTIGVEFQPFFDSNFYNIINEFDFFPSFSYGTITDLIKVVNKLNDLENSDHLLLNNLMNF